MRLLRPARLGGATGGGRGFHRQAEPLPRRRSGGGDRPFARPDAARSPERESAGAAQGCVGHSFAACGPSPGPVQLKTYLDNSDDNIYKDSEHDDLELAYLGSGGTPLFAVYGSLMAAVDHVERAWSRIPKKTRRDLYDNDVEKYGKNHHFMLNNNRIRRIGKIYAEGLDGVLIEHGDASSNVDNLIAVVAAVARKGPLYRNVGGGSRLPAPEGFLFARGGAKEDALRRLGIDEGDFGKYSKVEFKAVGSMIFESYRTGLTTDEYNGVDGGDCVYVSTVEPRRSANARFRADGANYDETFSQVPTGSSDERDLKSAFEDLPKPADSGWVPGTRLTKTDRGEGQAKAMNDWNALGAAAFANKHYGTNFSLSQNWEWLHLQGAQIGGATSGGNLTAGLFVVNSRMIPYENLIAHWANDGADKMWARFSPGSIHHSLTDQIVLKVVAENHPQLGTLAPSHPLEIRFNPTTGKVVDKLMGRLQERNLDRTPIVAPEEY